MTSGDYRQDSIIKQRQNSMWGSGDTMPLVFLFIAVYLIIVHLIPSYLFLPMGVKGPSMQPTIQNGDVVVLFLQGDIDYGDIVVAYAPGVYNEENDQLGEDIIKRVMAKPGDTIWFEKVGSNYRICLQNDGGIHYLDYEEYITPVRNGYDLTKRYTMGEDEYFVMGDNRDNSLDSREAVVGKINRSQIKGKVLLIIRNGLPQFFKRVHIFN